MSLVFPKAWKTKIHAAVPQPTEITPYDAEDTTKIDLTHLPFAANAYKISPRIEDYVIKSMPMMPSDTPNRNGISFPLSELIAFQPPPMNRQVYRSWIGCPVHFEHRNEDPTTALGIVLDTSLRPIKNYGNGKHWMVHGLLAIDKTKYPEIAERVRTGDLNTGSMGAMANRFTCGVCNADAYEETFRNCGHIQSTKNVNWHFVDHDNKKKLAFLHAHELSPIEFSLVEQPAWISCLSDSTPMSYE